MFFDTKIDKYAGVDIGDSSIKLVELSRNGEEIHLNTYAELATAPYAGFSSGQAVKVGEEKLIEALTDIYKESKSNANKFSISIPMSGCNIMHLSFPKDSADILDVMVPIELRKYTPVPASEMLISYDKLPDHASLKSGIKNRENINLVVLSIRNNVFESAKRVSKALPGEIVSIEPSLFGVLRALNISKVDATLVIDIGATITTIAFLNQGVLYSATTINMGSQNITDHIKDSLSITFDDAEKIKKNFGLYGDSKNILLKDITILAVRRLSEEVIHIRNRYEMRYNIKCSEVWLCGGGSRVLGMDKFLQEELKVKVNLSNAFDRVSVPKVMHDMLLDESPAFTSAIGLAISHL